VRVDAKNPFIDEGTELRGHEFHYSRLEAMDPALRTVLHVQRGEGLGGGRDGILVDQVLAAYTHIHALGTPEWADNLVRVAAGRKELRASQRAYREPAIHSGERRRKGKLRRQVEQLVRERRFDELDELVAEKPRTVRHLLSLSYQPDDEIREAAAQGLARATRHHPDLLQNVVRRLIWAMNEESGTNAQSAPAVLQAIAEEDAEFLLPVLPDLIRLAADEGLYRGLAKTLLIIKDSCPGKIGRSLGEALNRKVSGREPYGVGSVV
jgi:hypothetical protein